MAYYLFRQDMNPGVWAVRASDGLDFEKLREGAKIGSLTEPLMIELAGESEVYSDYLELPYFIISEKLKKALLEFGVNNIDFYKVNLVLPDNSIEKRFSLGNILGVVSCVDESKSKFKKLPFGGKILREFEVDESQIKEFDLFRLFEYKSAVLVSEKLKNFLENIGFDGLYFQETNKFDGKPVSTVWEM